MESFDNLVGKKKTFGEKIQRFGSFAGNELQKYRAKPSNAPRLSQDEVKALKDKIYKREIMRQYKKKISSQAKREYAPQFAPKTVKSPFGLDRKKELKNKMFHDLFNNN